MITVKTDSELEEVYSFDSLKCLRTWQRVAVVLKSDWFKPITE